ncbi:MAG: TaqI-like C-terminal specificity domain-containing protein, partial [Pseudomonadota bacterium]
NSLIAPDFFDNLESQQRNTQYPIRNTNNDLYQKINPFDWKQEFPQIFNRKNPGFDAVIGNPPWGQKGVSFDENTNLYLRTRYTSVTGILDIFRPFVERGIMLTLSGGMFGMVLPDIILLKDYEETRKCILEDLSITEIDWWGMAFASAVIDTATIIGQKKPAPEDHLVAVRVHDFEHPLSHEIPQLDFRRNPRCVFNLFLTQEKRQILEELGNCPKLGDFFQVHEGVHSGNIRKELFVDEPVDDTCQQLLFGRDEIAPYHLKWNGRYIRHSMLPQKKSKKFYANGGRPEWYAQDKVLVRRTGDFVLAALDSERRYASNNFFILFPKTPCSLSLAGLCAFLNSRFATWYFRTIEPRTGRVFAELKIKHLNVFPIPPSARDPNGCQALNELGTRRIQLATKAFEAKTPHEEDATHRICAHLDRKIDNLVAQLLGIEIPPELQSHQ